MKYYIYKKTKTLRKFYITYIAIFCLIYLISIIKAIFYLPINLLNARPKLSNPVNILTQSIIWLKLCTLSPIIILITHFITTQWMFNIKKTWHTTALTSLLKITLL